MADKTIFSQILNGEIDCDEIYQDKKCLVFKDIDPQAPVHFLIIPRKPLVSLKEATDADTELLGHLLLVSAKVAKQEGLESWRTIINSGAEAGQTVFHLHLHVLGGRSLSWPPG